MEIIHMGNKLKKEIDKNGKKISQISNELGISRTTIYNKLKSKYINIDFLINFQKIIPLNLSDFGYKINVDYSNKLKKKKEKYRYSSSGNYIFEKLKNHILVGDDMDVMDKKIIKLNDKYLNILEKYNELLLFLIKIYSNCHDESIKDKIKEYIQMSEVS